MKKDRLFGKFYFESLRQTRVVGIIFCVIFAVSCIVSFPLRYFFETVLLYDPDMPVILTFQDLYPLRGVVSFIMAPLITLFAFSFMNKRKSSDFYHSAAQKRGQIYFACALSCVTWIVIALIVPTILSILITLCFGGYYTINWGSFIYLIERLVSSVYVVAATTLAMTLTGTLLNNVLVTGIIIYIPRILLGVIASAVNTHVSVITGTQQLGILNPRYNLIIGDFVGAFDFYVTKYDISPIIYTAIIAAIYFILAYIAFRVRPSESAGQSAPSRFLQAIYRIGFTAGLCSWACILIFGMISNGFEASTMTFVIVIYVFALITWFVYELITTRKLVNLLRSMPSLLILVALNVAMILTMSGIKIHIESFRPAPDEIEYIKIVDNSYDFYDIGYIDVYDYLLGDLSKVEIKDDEVNKIVSEALIKTISGERENNDEYLYTSIVYEPYKSLTLGIKSESGLKYRTVSLITQDSKLIFDTLKKTVIENYGLNKFPDLSKVTFETNELKADDLREVYKTFIDEINSMDPEYLLDVFDNSEDSYYDEYNSKYIYALTEYEGKEITLQIPLLAELEKTRSKYFEILNNENTVRRFLNTNPKYYENWVELTMELIVYEDGIKTHAWTGSPEVFIESDMFEILKNNMDEFVDESGNYVNLSISYYDANREIYVSGGTNIALTADLIATLPDEIFNGK